MHETDFIRLKASFTRARSIHALFLMDYFNEIVGEVVQKEELISFQWPYPFRMSMTESFGQRAITQ